MSSSKIATLLLTTLLSACATTDPDDDDLGIEPACEDDTKCDASSSSEYFEIFQGNDGKFYFHLVAGNREIVMRSQGYTTKYGATKGIESVRANGVDPSRYKVLEAVNGEFYVNLYARNNAIIATSELYTRKFNAQRGRDTAVALIAKAQRLRAASTGGARFETFTGADHQSYFRLRAANGEIMLASEGYLHRASALGGIASVRSHGKAAANYDILPAANTQWFFHLQAANNEIIGRGETYVSESNAQRAVDSLAALLASELVADPAPVTAPSRSITAHRELALGVDALADIAATGPGLVYFGAAEQATRPADLSCEPATTVAVQAAYQAIVDEVVAAGDASVRADLTTATIAASKAQLGTLLGSDSYELCTREVAGSETTSTQLFVLSTRADGVRLVFERGYE